MAEYSLEEVKALVAVGTFSLKATRCRDSIVEHFGCTTKEAREKFQEMVAALTEKSFSETLEQRFGQKFDIYGLKADGAGWYLKIAVDINMDGEEEVVGLSCHPLERPIKTKGGQVTP